MTGLYLNGPASLALQAGACLSGGALIGALHFRTLRWNVGLLVARRTALLPAALQLGRMAALAGALTVIADRFGAFPLLMATAGIVAVRAAALRVGERA